MWERFGFYGMQALIVYYMVQRLNFPDERAALVWGAASALIYVAPAIGGWVGDRVLGTRRTMLLGAVVLAIGYGLMVVPGDNVWFLFCSLGVIVVGNGLFKANTGNLVRKIYEGDDSRIDSAFTIYYMAVNLGAMISQLLTPGSRTTSMNGMATAWAGTSRLRCARSACCWAWAIPRSPAIRN